jgi:hypothetical protein
MPSKTFVPKKTTMIIRKKCQPGNESVRSKHAVGVVFLPFFFIFATLSGQKQEKMAGKLSTDSRWHRK